MNYSALKDGASSFGVLIDVRDVFNAGSINDPLVEAEAAWQLFCKRHTAITQQ